eukprot:TRINITY_DN9635_c0_g1_i3.p2 TRINITY_DN9635_c0_g1~~TRINITY_DN9635_c0_g1_i3.p2  ORF type:complete len:154 (+),score=30.43 TRINITY_DN9635_c0_g1_i3:58-519(+)
MSREFRQKLLASSGVSHKAVESEIGMKLLQKMGWNQGDGLGKNRDGIKECIQVKRRDELVGLGTEKKGEFKWNDNWWEQTFNSAISKVGVPFNAVSSAPPNENESDSTSSDEEDLRAERMKKALLGLKHSKGCLLYTSPSPRDRQKSRMPSSA